MPESVVPAVLFKVGRLARLLDQENARAMGQALLDANGQRPGSIYVGGGAAIFVSVNPEPRKLRV